MITTIMTTMITNIQLVQHLGRRSNPPHTHRLVPRLIRRVSLRTRLHHTHHLGQLLVLRLSPLHILPGDLQVLRFHTQPESRLQIQRQTQLQGPHSTRLLIRRNTRLASHRNRQVINRLQDQLISQRRRRLLALRLCQQPLLPPVVQLENQPRNHLTILPLVKSHLKLLP